MMNKENDEIWGDEKRSWLLVSYVLDAESDETRAEYWLMWLV